MSLLDWFRRRRKNSLGIKKLKEEEAPPVDEEKEALERTCKLRNEIQDYMEEESNKRKRKKGSV
ncbi:MAG: hypothetical protein O2U61_03665 [Candidatus Bathyarchaeota archaeon]|nr:hypothetical protein [Candidatus Bathyarchaeota archaeon]